MKKHYSEEMRGLAERINSYGQTEKEVFIDPASIMLICAILSTIFNAVRMWRTWRATSDDIDKLKKRAKRRGFFTRCLLRRAIKENAPNVDKDEAKRLENNIIETLVETDSDKLLKIIQDNQ